jgi:hypothetical protein
LIVTLRLGNRKLTVFTRTCLRHSCIVHCLAESALFELPEPIQFSPRTIGDTPFMVAVLPESKKEIFLEKDSYQTLDNYLSLQFSRSASTVKTFGSAKPLILVGPVKSGTSTLLRAIAGHLTHRYHECRKKHPSAFRPLLLMNSFPLNAHPAHAAQILLDSLQPAAAEFSVQLPTLSADSSASARMLHISEAFEMVAHAAWKQNVHIWLFLDRIHVRQCDAEWYLCACECGCLCVV